MDGCTGNATLGARQSLADSASPGREPGNEATKLIGDFSEAFRTMQPTCHEAAPLPVRVL
jgi:hypothetical protein